MYSYKKSYNLFGQDANIVIIGRNVCNIIIQQDKIVVPFVNCEK